MNRPSLLALFASLTGLSLQACASPPEAASANPPSNPGSGPGSGPSSPADAATPSTSPAAPAVLTNPSSKYPMAEVRPEHKAGQNLPALVERLKVLSNDPTLNVAQIRQEIEAIATDRPSWQFVDRLRAFQGSSEDFRKLIRTAADDLAFVPIIEAPMPKDFPPYTPLGEIEFKRYPAYRMAVSNAAKDNTSDGRLFWSLFRHISKNDIPMTTPVEMDVDVAEDGSKMSMSRMGFMYLTPESGKAGKQDGIEVINIPETIVLTIGMRGDDAPARVKGAEDQLKAWLAAHPKWTADGATRTMGYNSPSVRNNRRYFEVQIRVRSTEG